MSDMHTISLRRIDGSGIEDRKIFVSLPMQAMPAGANPGAAVTLEITSLEDMPASYSIVAMPDQDAVAFATNKTANGFTLNVNPRLASETLVAGTVDILVFG